MMRSINFGDIVCGFLLGAFVTLIAVSNMEPLFDYYTDKHKCEIKLPRDQECKGIFIPEKLSREGEASID